VPPKFSLTFVAPSNTNVIVSACKNCRIITAPNTGILSVERCENVQLTALSGLVRVRYEVTALTPATRECSNVR
jgi:hypothetical protein